MTALAEPTSTITILLGPLPSHLHFPVDTTCLGTVWTAQPCEPCGSFWTESVSLLFNYQINVCIKNQ